LRAIWELLAEYGPHVSLVGASGEGVASHAGFVKSPADRGYLA